MITPSFYCDLAVLFLKTYFPWFNPGSAEARYLAPWGMETERKLLRGKYNAPLNYDPNDRVFVLYTKKKEWL
jgi:hypothetical protein